MNMANTIQKFLFLFLSILIRISGNDLQHVKELYSCQEHELAFKNFLEILKKTESKSSAETLEEDKFYSEALSLYLSSCGNTFVESNEKLIAEYGPIINEHPEFYRLTFLVAAAYANRGDLLRYFDLFFHAYCKQPNHYLAHKMKAILWIKLFERELPGPVKEIYRREILKELERALDLFAKDPSLYRLLLFYALDENLSLAVRGVLNKMMQINIIPARADLTFYIQKALASNEVTVAQKFVAKAREWYPSSRILNEADEQLKNISSGIGTHSITHKSNFVPVPNIDIKIPIRKIEVFPNFE